MREWMDVAGGHPCDVLGNSMNPSASETARVDTRATSLHKVVTGVTLDNGERAESALVRGLKAASGIA